MIRDSFINGLSCNYIQRLLENTQLTLEQAHDKARTLDLAQKNSEVYSQNGGWSKKNGHKIEMLISAYLTIFYVYTFQGLFSNLFATIRQIFRSMLSKLKISEFL